MRFGHNVITCRGAGVLSLEPRPVTMQAMDGSESSRIAAPALGQRIPRRKVAITIGVWAALVAGALGAAAALDTPPAPPPPASVAPEGLPPLFLYLDRALPTEVTKLADGASQVSRLEELATTTDEPARWVELGAVAQRVGDLGSAKLAFERALTVSPGRLDARVGLVMNDGATGPEGLARAAAALQALAPGFPTSQLLAFNTGMIAVYRADRPVIASAFSRAASLGPTTPLGVLARRFGAAGAPPPPGP